METAGDTRDDSMPIASDSIDTKLAVTFMTNRKMLRVAPLVVLARLLARKGFF
jgi:hypothetical protein